MIPAAVPDDRAIRPLTANSIEDGWSLRVNLDPAKNWSASTFTTTATSDPDHPVLVDATHKADIAPYVLLTLPPASLFAITTRSVTWYLAEDVVLDRTFLTGVIRLVDR